MDNSPEELEAQKARAFRPPIVGFKEDLRYLINFSILSIGLFFSIYLILGYILSRVASDPTYNLRRSMLYLSFGGSIIFGVLRTLRFSMAQTASDAYMVFPMNTKNVSGHLRELVNLATQLEWDLTGLIGSLFVLLTIYFVV